MDRAGLEKQVLQIVSERVGLPAQEIPMEETFDTLGFDSMGALNILFALEDEFDISIDNQKAARINSVSKLLDVLAEELEL